MQEFWDVLWVPPLSFIIFFGVLTVCVLLLAGFISGDMKRRKRST
jgi:hypothetical protein